MPPKRKLIKAAPESETQIKVHKKVPSASKTSPQASTSGTTNTASIHQSASGGINTSTHKTGRTDITSKHGAMTNARITRASLRSSLKVKARRTSVKSVRVTRGFLRSSILSKTENLPEDSSKWMTDDGKSTLICKDKNRGLLEACRKVSLKITRELLVSGADINYRSTGGWTPVLVAADRGNIEIFDFLVEQGCDMSLKLDNGNTILHLACSGNNADIVNYIISHNVESIESKGMNGQTPVMEAASVGNKTIFDLLLSHGCDLTTTDDTGNNILHLACYSDNVDIVSYIISHNIANINSKSKSGITPVMFAAVKGQKHVFDFLVSQGCDLTTIGEDGNNILHLACYNDNVDIVDYILSHNIADINSKGLYGRTPVMFAAENGQKRVFDFLVSQGCDLRMKDEDGDSILHLTCFSDNVDIVGYILSHNIADINSKGFYGRTPVMFAAENGQKHVFDFLVSQGCDLTTIDDTGNNIFHLACFSDNVDIIRYILSHNIADINSKGNSGSTPVMFAAENGQKHVFDYLVSQGCDLTTTDDRGYNIFHLACFSDSVDIVNYILSHNIADINSKGKYGRTSVMFSAEKGQKHVFDILVSQGCDLATIDEDGNNILHLACFSDNVYIVSYILSHNIADINSKDNSGNTPVMFAAENGQKHVFDYLVSQGCDLTTTDDRGYNILHIACFSDNVDIVSYILSHQIVDINSKGFEGRTPVMTAAEKGQKHVFDFLVSQGCDVTTTDDFGYNILHHACVSGNVNIVSYILSLSTFDINTKCYKGRTPVMKAARNGQKKVFDLLVSQGCDLTTVDHEDNNILHVAAMGNSVNVVPKILSQGIVDINGRNRKGQTALKIARNYQQNKVASLLVDKGASDR